MNIRTPKPDWLKIKLPAGEGFAEVQKLMREQDLHTVCSSARCPNQGECWSNRTATFMILGDACTRNCTFCAVDSAKPGKLDPNEPERVAESVKKLGLKYTVITSVTRDDLPDGGAGIFARTVQAIRSVAPECRIELLIPDFGGQKSSLQKVSDTNPDVLGHNLETVPELYRKVRPQAIYQRSLDVLRWTVENGIRSKTGLMLGLGESRAELIQVFREIIETGCKLMTLGQYLQPTKRHHAVVRYVPPGEFDELAEIGRRMGFDHIEAGPLVRSSYRAHQQVDASLR
ncbi:lipoyl synthase [bacterium]|nr:lipoyl synthase [bacterium]